LSAAVPNRHAHSSHFQWTGSQGLLKQLWDPTCLESMVGLLAGSLYHIQRQAHVPSMLAIENYGHLAQLASSDRFFERRYNKP